MRAAPPLPPFHMNGRALSGECVHQGNTVALRRMRPADAALLHARAFGNPEFMRAYRAHDFSPDVADVEARIAGYLGDPELVHHHLELVIEHRERGPVGLLALTAWNPATATAELQIALFDPESGGNAGGEALLLALDLAFNAYGVRQLVSLVYDDVADGHRASETFGFRHDSRFHAEIPRGEAGAATVGIVRYHQTADDFRRNPRLARASRRLIGRDITQPIPVVTETATPAQPAKPVVSRPSRRTARRSAARAWRPRAIATLVAGLFAAPALANTYSVSVTADDGTGTVADTLSWAIAQANANPGADVIQIGTDVTMTGVMRQLIDGDLTVQNDGSVRTVFCQDNPYRPFFIKSGTVLIDGVIVGYCQAVGGSGSGGGAGLGGAIFVNAGSLTLQNATLTGNAATGGAGSPTPTGLGGGGMRGSGVTAFAGGGGGGLYGDAVNAAGGLGDSDLGHGGDGPATLGNSATGGDGGFGGGGGGAHAEDFGSGPATAAGGRGGFGGGGGGAYAFSKNSAASASGGAGGFGGGGGMRSAFTMLGPPPVGMLGEAGYGGVSANDLNGGGAGAGFGGAIFVRNGSLVMKSVTFASNQANGADGSAGQGGALFVCTSDLDSDNTSSGAMGSCGGSIDTANSCGVTFSGNTATTSENDVFWSDGAGGQQTLANVPASCNQAPIASAVALSGTAVVGQTLTGSYTYGDTESDPQDTSGTGSSYRIVRSTDNDVATTGDNADAATGSTGGNNDTYAVASADAGKYLFYCVTPKATTGVPTGTEVCSSASAQVPIPVDGACGSDDGQTLTDTPGNLCTTGAASTVTSGTTSYTWTCDGTNGSVVDDACSATRNYLVTPSAGANGSIAPNTVQQVAYNAAPSFMVTANSGYVAIVSGTCGGNLVGSTYTTQAVAASCNVSATFVVENDGVDAAVENAAPNGGDGNGDGTLDSQQANVTSLPRPNGGHLTIATDCPAGLTGVQTYTEASQGGGDPIYNLPYGQVGFSAACANATFTVYYHGVSSVAGMTYRKYGPTTPGIPATMAWYTLPGVTFGTATVGGQPVATATFTLNDNQLGDDTGEDGVIVDQGGPANGNGAAAIPTLTEWGMTLLASLMAIGSLFTLRRRRLSE